MSDEPTTLAAIAIFTAAASTAASAALQPKIPSLIAQPRVPAPSPPAELPPSALPSVTEATEGEAEERRRIVQRGGIQRTLLSTPLGVPRIVGTGA